jgi:alpha-L-fucosidase
VTTRKGERLFIHIFDWKENQLTLPLTCKVKNAFTYEGNTPVKFKQDKQGNVTLTFDEVPSGVDFIVELITK